MLALFCARSATASLASSNARAFAGNSSNLIIAPATTSPAVSKNRQQMTPAGRLNAQQAFLVGNVWRWQKRLILSEPDALPAIGT